MPWHIDQIDLPFFHRVFSLFDGKVADFACAEGGMNCGICDKELPERLAASGEILAAQTLSRLNRIHPGECARHNRPSPCDALERAQGDVVRRLSLVVTRPRHRHAAPA